MIKISYDLAVRVKAEGCNVYPIIATPEYDTPTYNLSKMFRACMDWDYSQSAQDGSGKYHQVYYNCAEVMPKIERGIKELHTNRKEYEQYNPENGWGNINGAIKSLESLRDCIYEQAENIPLDCLYMSW